MLRDALLALKAATGIGTQTLLDQCNLPARVPKGERVILRAALEAFIKGGHSNRAVALGTLHDFLRAHPVYREYFPTPPPLVACDFSSALASFFVPRGSVKNRYSTEAVCNSLPGEYVMMRRNFEEGAGADAVRTSHLAIKDAGDSIIIEERQDYQQPHDALGYRQRDTGYVFTYADYVYFLMKEEGNTATAIKLGVISYAAPDIGDGQADFFAGYMFVSSRRGIFPLARFACRRYSPELHPQQSGIIKLSDIRDPRAFSYIKLDYA